MDSRELRTHWQEEYLEVGLMKNAKVILKYIPEIYLMLLVIYYWIDTGLFNPFAITFFLALSLLLYFRSKVMGITISVFFILVNMYMFLALLSEFHEFPTFNDAAKTLLFVGTAYIGANLIMGIVMLIKYLKSNRPLEVQTPV